MNAFSDLIPSATPPDNASTPDQSAPASGLPQATVDRAMAIYQGRRDRGDDSATALGWAANGVLESKGTPYTPRSSTGAAGTFQWLGDRLKNYQTLYGHDPEDGDLDEHLNFVDWENQNSERLAYQKVQAAPLTPEDRAGAIRTHWERPGTSPENAIKEENMARAMARHLTPVAMAFEERYGQKQPASSGNPFSDLVPKQNPFADLLPTEGVTQQPEAPAQPQDPPTWDEAKANFDKLHGASAPASPEPTDVAGPTEVPPAQLYSPELVPPSPEENPKGWNWSMPNRGAPSQSGVMQPVASETLPDNKVRITGDPMQQPMDERLPPQSYVKGVFNAGAKEALGSVGHTVAAAGDLPEIYAGRENAQILSAMKAIDEDRPEDAVKGLSEIDRGALSQYLVASPEQRQVMRAAAQNTEDQAQGMAKRPGNMVTRAGEAIQKTADDIRVNPENEGYGTAAARVAGGLLPVVGTGLVSGPASAVTVPLQVGLQSYDTTLREARANGASEHQAEDAAALNALGQMVTVGVPIHHVLSSIPDAPGLWNAIKSMGVKGLEFGGLNGVGTFIDNWVAKHTYDPDRSLTEGVATSVATGVPTGGALHAIPATRQALRERRLDQAAKRAEDGLTAAPPADVADKPPEPDSAPVEPAPTQSPPIPEIEREGHPVPPTTPEPQGDLEAQIAAVADKDNPKDAVFIAKGTAVPYLPEGLHQTTRDEGTLVSNNPAKLHAFHDGPLTDEKLASILGYPEAKPNAIASGNPVIVEGTDAQGNTVTSTVTSPEKVPEATAAAGAQAPNVEIKTPEQAQAERQQKLEAEQTSALADPTKPTPVPPASGAYIMLRPDDLIVDPERFQYKQSGEGGVTGALHGVDRWEPALANPITVWQGEDGKYYVVNGHQRTDLARRAQAAGQENVQMPARVYRESDGYTPEYMKILGAYQNMAEGSGTAIDAAKVLRGQAAIPAGRELPALPPKGAIVAQARSLQGLSDPAFDMVANGVVPPAYAAHVGDMIKDPTEQMAALDMLVRAHPASSEQARLMVQDIRNSGYLKGAQTTLFGDEAFAKSLIPERARILDNAMRNLRRTKTVFKAAVEGEETLTAAGNTLDHEANTKAKTENERLLDYLQRDATKKGEVSDELNKLAAQLADGKITPAAAASRFLFKARDFVKRGPDESLRSGASPGGEQPPPDVEKGGRGEDDVPGQGRLAENPLSLEERRRPADDRQVTMPGMGPSAKQAQASRDQAGRGALLPKVPQKPADEGLFAPKAPDQPGLFDKRAAAPEAVPEREPRTKSMFPLVKGNTDLMSPKSGRVERGIDHTKDATQESRDWTLENGSKTGSEYLTVVGRDRVLHAITSDEPDEVLVGSFSHLPDKSVVIHHNHPGDRGLSDADLETVFSTPQIHSIVAHATNDVFSASANPNFHPELSPAQRLSRAQAAIKLAYIRTLEEVRAAVRKGIPEPVGQASFWDIVARALHARGAINYTSTREVPDALKPILEKLVNGYKNPRGGSADTVRLDQAIGRLREAGRSGSGTSGAVIPDAETRAPSPRDQQPESGTPRATGPVGTQGRLLERREPKFDDDRQEELLQRPKKPEDAKGPRLEREIRSLNLPPEGETIKSKKYLAKMWAQVRAGLSPTSFKGAKAVEGMLRIHGAVQAQDWARSVDRLQDASKLLGRLTTEAQDEFTHRMETGQAQPTPEMTAAAQALRESLDQWRDKIRSLGKGLLDNDNFVENYMGHIYSNYAEWRAGKANPPQSEIEARAAGAMQGKKPMQGSGNFLKKRTYDTLKEAMADGLEPVTHNPVDLQLMKLREMQKFYHGTRLGDLMKQTHVARWVRKSEEGDAKARGLVPLDDKFFQPRIGDPRGLIEPGNWFAPEAQARVFNNYVSEGLAGHYALYDALRKSGGVLNNLQLSLSGFHAAFVTLDTAASSSALGLYQVIHGRGLEGVKNIALGTIPGLNLYSVRRAYVAGKKMQAAWLDPEHATPEWADLAKRLNEGGGRINMDPFYKNSNAGTYFHKLSDFKDPLSPLRETAQYWRDHPEWQQRVMIPLQIVGRTMDTIMHPLMGHLVPKAKLGVFSMMARDWQAAHPDASDEERSRAMIKAWDTVDNRLGQVVYDNIYWSKKLKDTAFVTTRSVGWNLGTIRELGGGLVDTGAAANDLAHLRKPDFTYRMAYTMMLPINTMIIGGLITKLATGENPQDLYDYFYPRTGGEDERGGPARISIPGYMKDVFAAWHDPVSTVTNKLHPLLATGQQVVFKGEDYYGHRIYNPHIDASWEAQYADYLINQATPFAYQAMSKMQAEGQSPLAVAAGFWGFQPAPASITHPEREEAYWNKRYAREARPKAQKGKLHFFTPSPEIDASP